MARDDLHFRLRIPEDLKGRIEESAHLNRRSMTAEIVHALSERYPPLPSIQQLINRLGKLASELQSEENEAKAEEFMILASQIFGRLQSEKKKVFDIMQDKSMEDL